MWINRFVLRLFIVCLVQLFVTSGQKQDMGVVLNRLSNIEALFVEERLKTISLQRQLSELKSRLDEFTGGGSATHQIYEDNKIKGYVSEIMTNSLDIIQDGLLSEKQQRLRLENMAVEVKEIVRKQNAKESYKQIKQKTSQLEKRLDVLERTYLTPSTNFQTRSSHSQNREATRPTIPPKPTTRAFRRPKQTIRPTRPPRQIPRQTRPPILATYATRPPRPATYYTRPPLPATCYTRPPISRNTRTWRTIAPHLLRPNRLTFPPIQRRFGPKRN